MVTKAKKAPRNTNKYLIGNYAGITNNPKRRAGEHKRAGRTGKMKVVGRKVTRQSALAWERSMKAKKRGRR